MKLQFTTETQSLTNAEWHSVIELESVVQRFVVILRIAVGEINVIRCGAEVVGHIGRGGAVVELVSKGQRLGVLLVEETLVVETSVERGARILHVGGAAIRGDRCETRGECGK